MAATDAKANILIVEDDPSIQLGLRMNLSREGYAVGLEPDGASGLERLREGGWDLCILDVMLPQLSGYEVLERMKEEGLGTPVLMLSARTGDEDKVVGLDLGAEDYVTKPFSVPELLARVRAALRRNQQSRDVWRFGRVVIDVATRQVTRGGEPVELTVTEFDILAALVRAEGKVMTREQIFQAVWGEGHHGTRRTVDNFIGQLRQKLEDDPSDPQHLLTVRGVGYRLVPRAPSCE